MKNIFRSEAECRSQHTGVMKYLCSCKACSYYITTLLKSLYWLPVSFRKNLPQEFKTLYHHCWVSESPNPHSGSLYYFLHLSPFLLLSSLSRASCLTVVSLSPILAFSLCCFSSSRTTLHTPTEFSFKYLQIHLIFHQLFPIPLFHLPLYLTIGRSNNKNIHKYMCVC